MNVKFVLLVEDDTSAAALMVRALQKADSTCDVHVLENGEQAVTYLSERLGTPRLSLPSVVITDLKMPRMNGHEVLAWVQSRSELSGMPVVVMSSSNDPADIDRAMSLGARAYFEKPLGLREQVEIACSILAGQLDFQTKK